MTQTRPWFRKEPGGRVGTLAKCLFIFLQGEGFAPAGATKGLSDRPLETFGPHTGRSACKLGNWWVHLSNIHTFFQQLEK